MNAVYLLICAAGSIAAALAFIALGMKISNETNKKSWEKYYEGLGKKTAAYSAATYTPNVVPMEQRKAR